jgi:hypothetical protein
MDYRIYVNFDNLDLQGENPCLKGFCGHSL